MFKAKHFLILFCLIALVLIGSSCEEWLEGIEEEYEKYSKEDKKEDKKETEWGYDEKGNRILLPEPEMKCWPADSEVGSGDSSEKEVKTILGVEAIEKCKSVECKTSGSMEWMTIVDHFKSKMESSGWIKSGGQNLYYSDWQTFTIWYQGYNKAKQQSYRLEYCDIIPKKDLE